MPVKINFNYTRDEYVNTATSGMKQSSDLKSKSDVLKSAKQGRDLYNRAVAMSEEYVDQFISIKDAVNNEPDVQKKLLLMDQGDLLLQGCYDLIELCMKLDVALENLVLAGKPRKTTKVSDFMRRSQRKLQSGG